MTMQDLDFAASVSGPVLEISGKANHTGLQLPK